jgi:hypothetical protein
VRTAPGLVPGRLRGRRSRRQAGRAGSGRIPRPRSRAPRPRTMSAWVFHRPQRDPGREPFADGDDVLARIQAASLAVHWFTKRSPLCSALLVLSVKRIHAAPANDRPSTLPYGPPANVRSSLQSLFVTTALDQWESRRAAGQARAERADHGVRIGDGVGDRTVTCSPRSRRSADVAGCGRFCVGARRPDGQLFVACR